MKYVLKATLDNITERAAKNAGIDVQMSLFFYLCIIIIIWNLSISLYTAKIRRLLSSEKVDTGHIDAFIGGDKSFLFDSLCVSVFLFMAAFMLLYTLQAIGFDKIHVQLSYSPWHYCFLLHYFIFGLNTLKKRTPGDLMKKFPGWRTAPFQPIRAPLHHRIRSGSIVTSLYAAHIKLPQLERG